jgi:hypothetical protein
MDLKTRLTVVTTLLLSFWFSLAGAQEKVIVSHTTRGSFSSAPLLYGIDRGKTLITGDVDYLYSVGTIIRGTVLGLPVKTRSFDFARVMHFLTGRPEVTSAAALKGKRVGVSSFGATGDLAARVASRPSASTPAATWPSSPWAR